MCEKCGKKTLDILVNVYNESLCEDCWDDYLMTDRGKVEYFIGICKGELPISDYDAEFLGWVSCCWTKYRDSLEIKLSDLHNIEAKAQALGLLD